MNHREMIVSAATKVGSISELARRLAWDKGSIAGIKAGKHRLPPYRAAQLAEIIGDDPKTAYLTALAEKAESEGERRLLRELRTAFKRAAKVLTIAALAGVASFTPSKHAYASTDDRTNRNIHYSP